jgi:hypothetical protein
MAGILGGQGGVGSSIAGNQLGLGQLGLGYAQLGTDTWYKQNQLALEKERMSREGQLDAFRYIAPYLMSTA